MSEASTPSLEARLLLACARLELDAEARERIAQCMAQGTEPERLYALAERHGLRPLLFRHLGEGEFGRLPAPIESRLWQHGEQLRVRNARLEVELVATIALLEEAGIPAAAHKGPVLAHLAYEDAALREYGDLDVLLPLAEVPRARELLAMRGFEPKYPLSHEAERAFLGARSQYQLMMVQPASGLLLELHWRTDGEFAVEDTSDPAWWQGTDGLEINSAMVKVLPRDAMLLALLLHGSKHYWGSLHWLVDVAELARRSPRLDWNRVVEGAERLQARHRLALGLLLLRDWLHVDFPQAVTNWLGRQESMQPMADAIARDWFDPAPALSPWQRLREDSRLYDTSAQRRRHVVDVVFQPGLPEWSGTPLPPALFFLYPVLRLLRLARQQLRRLLRTERVESAS